MPNPNESNKPTQNQSQTMRINPCGICRANNIPPPCRGHASSGSGGGSDGGKDDGAKNENTLKYSIPESNKWASYLLQQNDIWSRVPDAEDMTLKCDNSESLLSIKLDGDKGIIQINGKMGLSDDEKKDLYLLFKAIMDEFKQFKKQYGITDNHFSATPKDDNLTITIPNTKMFDLFVQQLMKANLIPTPNNMKASMQYQATTAKNESEGVKYKTPTPFDRMHKLEPEKKK